MVSPLRTHEILIGKTVPPLIIGLFQIDRLYPGRRLPLRGAAARLAVPAVRQRRSSIWSRRRRRPVHLGLAETQQQAILGAFLFMVPAMLLSGFATPIENMPDWLQP